MKDQRIKTAICGALAGAVNGLFGAGGGMILVPVLTAWTDLEDEQIFPCSVSIILPICLVSLISTLSHTGFPIGDALPFLLGSIPGGLAAGILDRRLPVIWMHRILGIIILWGGIRYLC